MRPRQPRRLPKSRSTDRPPDDGRAGDNWLPFRGRWRWLALSIALGVGAWIVFFGSVGTCMEYPNALPTRHPILLFIACTIGAITGVLMAVGAAISYRRGLETKRCPSKPEPNAEPTDSDLGFGS